MIRRLQLPAALLLTLFAIGTGSMTRAATLPDIVDGWKTSGRDSIYNRETIYDYMDGAAELYLSYSLNQLIVRNLHRSSQPSITLELYVFDSSADAYGVFSLQREGTQAGIGTDSEYARGLLRFWKGDFFVNVYSERETPEAETAILTIGNRVAQSIPHRGIQPPLLTMLPRSQMQEKTIRYFHNHVCLNYCYFIASENILNLGKETEAVLGTIDIEGEGARILLVAYRDRQSAGGAHRQFIEAYMPEVSESGTLRTENKKWTGAFNAGKYIVAVLDAPTEDSLLAVLEDMREILEVTGENNE
jgi:hypothetical protein